MPLIRLAPIAAIVALSLALIRVVAAADSSPSPGPTASAPTTASSATAAKTAHVKTYRFAYDPNPLTVAVGTKVTFENEDDVAHTVTSADDDAAFDSGDMPHTAAWSHVFSKPGRYDYYCRYHTYMKGTVVVR